MKISSILMSGFVLCCLFACNKTDFNYPPDTVGGSKIVYFPTIALVGGSAVSVVKGAAFADPGAKADVNGTDVTVTTTGTVDVNTVGLYTVTYTAANADGFTASTSRVIVVIPQAEDPNAPDLSGTYTAIGGAPAPAVVTKVDAGLYHTSNCWGGGSSVIIPVYFYTTDGVSLNIPLQVPGAVGRIITTAPGTYSGGLIDWTVSRLDFGGGPLTVEKKWQK